MSATPRITTYQSINARPVTDRRVLEVRPIGVKERAYLEARFGADIEVDRAGNFYIVHRDSPSVELRSARLEEVRTAFRPSHCEHCAESVSRGGLYLYDFARYAPKELRIVPVDRAEAPCPVRSDPDLRNEEIIHATSTEIQCDAFVAV